MKKLSLFVTIVVMALVGLAGLPKTSLERYGPDVGVVVLEAPIIDAVTYVDRAIVPTSTAEMTYYERIQDQINLFAAAGLYAFKPGKSPTIDKYDKYLFDTHSLDSVANADIDNRNLIYMTMRYRG